MNDRRKQRENAVAEAARSLGLSGEPSARGVWRISVDDATAVIDVRIDDRWLACSSAVRPVSTGSQLWTALERCALLDGACKASIEPFLDGTGAAGNMGATGSTGAAGYMGATEKAGAAGAEPLCSGADQPADEGREHCLVARVDVPIAEGTDLPAACRRAVSDLLSARRALLGGNGEDRKRPHEDAAPMPPGAVEAAKEACIEAGWPVPEQPNGELRADLSEAGGPRDAAVQCFGEESYRAYVTLGSCRNLSAERRTAAAILLLSVNGAVRLARTGVAERGDRAEAFAEVWIRERASAGIFDHALSTLSLAYRLCHKELRVLGAETVAREYADVRGWSSHERSPAPQGGGRNPERGGDTHAQ